VAGGNEGSEHDVTKKILLATIAAVVLVLASLGIAITASSANAANAAHAADVTSISPSPVPVGDANRSAVALPDQAVGAGNAGVAADGAVPRTGTAVTPFVVIGVALIAVGLFAITTSIRRRSVA
jgi:uncharacterized membrane protein